MPSSLKRREGDDIPMEDSILISLWSRVHSKLSSVPSHQGITIEYTCIRPYTTDESSPLFYIKPSIRICYERAKQKDELGYNIAEKFHFDSASRGLADVDVEEYDWARGFGHFRFSEC